MEIKNNIASIISKSKYKYVFVDKKTNRAFHRLFRFGRKRLRSKFYYNDNTHISNNFFINKDVETIIIDVTKKTNDNEEIKKDNNLNMIIYQDKYSKANKLTNEINNNHKDVINKTQTYSKSTNNNDNYDNNFVKFLNNAKNEFISMMWGFIESDIDKIDTNNKTTVDKYDNNKNNKNTNNKKMMYTDIKKCINYNNNNKVNNYCFNDINKLSENYKLNNDYICISDKLSLFMKNFKLRGKKYSYCLQFKNQLKTIKKKKHK